MQKVKIPLFILKVRKPNRGVWSRKLIFGYSLPYPKYNMIFLNYLEQERTSGLLNLNFFDLTG